MYTRIIAFLLCGIVFSGCFSASRAWSQESVQPDTAHHEHSKHHATADHVDTGHDPPADSVPHDHEAVQETAPDTTMQSPMMHPMWMQPLGGGWHVLGMAQVIPVGTSGAPFREESPLHDTEVYATQAATMLNLESPGSRLVLRTTLNFEGITQPEGELTFGGWGEGFLDKRHPHTLLHEAVLSANFWNVAGGAASVSLGKGFAPYGTDDPMSRPVMKYPTNHHLSQILERWMLSGTYLVRGWSVEASIFGGAEPTGPYDFSNIESFGDSWSARVVRRFGGSGPMAPWEVSASYAQVKEGHGGEKESTFLTNAAVRHAGSYGLGDVYFLAEGSRSEPDEGDGHFALLAETMLTRGEHQPYARIEYATRPEYEREGLAGVEEFFRYDHDQHPIGATRWLITSLGYGYELTGFPFSTSPFIEVQHHRVWEESGGIQPEELFGADSFWSISAGLRIFLGGGPMRMGSYGVLDSMTAMHRGMGEAMQPGMPPGGHGHP